MELKELVGRNISAALRETMNARLAALHGHSGPIPDEVVDLLFTAEINLENAQAKLGGVEKKEKP